MRKEDTEYGLKQVPQKVALSQMVQAWNFDRDTMEGTTHRILKKFNQ